MMYLPAAKAEEMDRRTLQMMYLPAAKAEEMDRRMSQMMCGEVECTRKSKENFAAY